MTATVATGNTSEEPLSALPATRARPARPGSLSVSLTFAWRGLLKLKHVPEQLSDVIGIPILFTLMFTYLFGGALAGSTAEYLQFLLPGTLVMAVLLVSVYSGITLNGDISSGVFDRFRTLPIWRPAPIMGALLGDIARYLLTAALVLGLGLAMGFRPEGGALGVLAALALILVFALSLSWVWICLALVLRTPSSVQIIGLLILFPLTFTSNVFVDPQTMPAWLRVAVDLNPVSHLVTATRGLTDGTATGSQISWALAASFILGAVFAPLALRIYERS
jgi:daunorubicin/doxorubicin transport system permease protein